MATRFRGFLPVVIDVETGGFNAKTDALLEVAAVTLQLDQPWIIYFAMKLYEYHVEPFEGANLEQSAALDFTGIDLENENRLRRTRGAGFSLTV